MPFAALPLDASSASLGGPRVDLGDASIAAFGLAGAARRRAEREPCDDAEDDGRDEEEGERNPGRNPGVAAGEHERDETDEHDRVGEKDLWRACALGHANDVRGRPGGEIGVMRVVHGVSCPHGIQHPPALLALDADQRVVEQSRPAH